MKSGNKRQAARKFKEFWLLAKDSESGGYSKFWLSLLSDVLGVEDVFSRIDFQSPVPMKDTTKFLDAWIPETRVLIEHKARNVKLDAPQAGHGGKTPYEQALEYNIARPYSEKARWIVTCNFAEIWVYDMDHPLEDPQKILLANLPKEVSRLGFLVDSTVKSVREQEKDISIKAGRIVGELYKALLKRFEDGLKTGLTGLTGLSEGDPQIPKNLVNPVNPVRENYLAALNRLCVRLVFCFYAEDAEIFPKDCFWKLLSETPAKFLRDRIIRLFRTLDTPEGERDPYLEPELAAFPYTNGGLFRGVDDAEIPPLDDEIRELLVKSSNFDWRDISPTIFGALFESTLNPETRRAGGMVYTSVENIHKVIDPLFMNDLAAELESIKSERAIAVRRAKAAAFQDKLGSLTFLDPACGSGNFLTETFLSLRKLENEAIVVGERLKPGEVLLNLAGIVKVSIKQFHGIEINDFAVSVAKTAMWISEAKMLNETANILHAPPKYLPLHDYDGIVEGNALRMEWGSLISRRDAETQRGFDYIMGNPPFIGASMMTAEQKAEAVAIFGKGKRVNSIDYVGAWYYKAAELLAGTNSRCAFVSTNSVTQGEQVAPLWRKLFEKYGVEIDFAWRTFVWNSESLEKAHVHCVIVGFHVKDETPTVGAPTQTLARPAGSASPNLPSAALRCIPAPQLRATQPNDKRSVSVASDKSESNKTIFDNGTAIPAAHINAYLIDAPDIFADPRPKPICAVPVMTYGNKPSDGGNLILSEEERADILAATPALAPHIRRYVGSQDFINNDKVRYCLWLRDVSPSLYRSNAEVMRRLAAVREMRLASSAAPTRAMAATPYLFFSAPQTEDDYLLVPEVSSERREYVPMGFMTHDTIAANTVSIIPSATLYHFGVLTSSAHMAWMRAVAGRLKSDYRYSAAIVYNNFPWLGGGSRQGTKETEGTEGTRDKATDANVEAALSLKSLRSLSSLPYAAAISATAQAILDARARYPDSSLADLYDPLTMPPDLRAAHAANDRAVLAAYGLVPDTPEPEIVAHLFKLYAKMTKGTKRTEETKETERTKGTKVTEAARETREISQSLRSLQSISSLEGVPNG